MKHAVEDLLDKLAALGDKQHIAMYLAERGLRGLVNEPYDCIVAEYLKAERPDVEEVAVSVSRYASGTASWVEEGDWPSGVRGPVSDITGLPQVVNDLAAAFDRGEFPELKRCD